MATLIHDIIATLMAIFMTAFGAAADTPGEHGVDPAPAVTVVEECGIVNPFDHYRADLPTPRC